MAEGAGKLVGLVIGVVIGLVGGIVVIMGGVLAVITPSGGPSITSKYQETVRNTLTSINWEDPYMLDYFRHNNDFSGMTQPEIQATVNLFYKVVLVPKQIPNPDKKSKQKTITKMVPEKKPLSLLDVMTQLGYTAAQYNLALNIENTFLGTTTFTNIVIPETYLRYQSINPEALYQYVHQRDSVFSLSDVETIMNAGQQYDINPALLIAITGQEESFIPASWPAAQQIRNNPFNVYHSWQDYNTTLQNSADIAAGTLRAKLSTPPPDGEDPIHWINDPNNPDGAYAGDPNWPNGVEDIFLNIEQYLGTPVKISTITPTVSATKSH
ncbi:hypothetical protein [Alicyclobacillus mengziensis]|uniref:Uncharacterized protein n=1 Tax=Alicyclobacillus mengziensis TaxID=2931921 RepID=A0A9X7W3K2_9BACL|nr:hypothetical protein [Alicyclobacillus mengziensis]QSO50113.1 hypothetical protein JZ786_24670 [Alicyclobacillus mengziensis]